MMKLTTNNYRTKHAGWVHTLHAKTPKSKMTQPTIRRVAFGRRINYSEYVFLWGFFSFFLFLSFFFSSFFLLLLLLVLVLLYQLLLILIKPFGGRINIFFSFCITIFHSD